MGKPRKVATTIEKMQQSLDGLPGQLDQVTA
jgi:hypothetical protein